MADEQTTNNAEVLSKTVCATLMARLGKKFARKAPTMAVQMDGLFAVETASGKAVGLAGDWLVIDSGGNYIRISKAVFEETYRPFREPRKPEAE